ncbi:hypothetical protein LCGC14_1255720 [marine sediment metagenome]|uniref:Uncharacterized protein n=1 Tax=marine sediment metagenome TaxID=412755 RepID=A0A0F9LNE4_9ZZZZ
MERKITVKKLVCLFVMSIVFLFCMAGCTESQLRNVEQELTEVQGQVASVASAVGSQTYGPDETLNLLKALQAGNTASSPFNPYALPIGVGLTGIITVLEALRRKEKGSRKHAEHELRNGNNGKPPGKK